MKKITIISGILLVLFLGFLCIPVPHFEVPYSTVLVAKEGQLLGARIADDGQWRFPATNSYSHKYLQCVLEFEDKYFFLHPGFNPVSFISAARDNIKAGKIVRGGSTLSMQVVRLARKNKPRTFLEKFIEIILAIRLELRYSKTDIFNLYAAHAPFGGNVVGIDAAAWRYFNTTPDRLTWSEAATLAVLPNSPSLISPSKGRVTLKNKRNKLLLNLCESKVYLPKKYRDMKFSSDDYELSLLEGIPPKPYDLPTIAYHYLSDIEKENKEKYNVSDIDYDLQKYVNEVVKKYHDINSANGIENLAVYIIDYQKQEIVSYVGNYIFAKNAAMVDMIKAQRSTGSILKPYLYSACLDEGLLLPTMVLPDIPMNFSGYTPKNYSGNYSGVVPVNVALQKSLNTPFVYLLRKYSVQKFHGLLKGIGLSGIVYPPDHYGFSLILGGAEASLFDIVNAYGMMGLKLSGKETSKRINKNIDIPYSKAAISLTFDAMQYLNRPNEEAGWKYFNSSHRVAWKTGTSFGFKDAWAVGITKRYVVGIWCGNADGEGRPGLTGLNVAAPVMFEILSKLNDDYEHVELSDEESMEVEVCSISGMPISQYCPSAKKVKMPKTEIMTGVCPYHKKVFLDKTHRYRVFADCYSIDNEDYEIYYSLPPVMEWFYKKTNPLYRSMPPVMPGCHPDKSETVMSFIYPDVSSSLVIPIGIKGNKQTVIFELAHRNPAKAVFWTLNDKYLGKTVNNHQMPIETKPGDYILRCVDEDGNEITRKISFE